VDWLYRFDLSTFRDVNVDLHRSWLDPFFAALSYSGLGYGPVILAFLFLTWKDTRHYVIPLLATELLGGVIIADGLKDLIQRDRPSNLAFAIREEPHLASSFPSGHSTLAFAVATMLFFLTRNTKHRWFGLLSLVWAALVGFSRIYRGVHWPTDVLAGACLGFVSSCLLYFVLPKFGMPVDTA